MQMRFRVMRSALVLPVLCVATLSVGGTGQGGGAGQPPEAVKTIDITAERFSFTPSEIRTTVGTTLEIRLTSDDTAHGFRIVGTNVDLELPKRGRGRATVTFTPDRAGRYTFECSRLCGAGHEFMRGVIVVSEAGKESR
jgi:cytochrome c oxidase subunit II